MVANNLRIRTCSAWSQGSGRKTLPQQPRRVFVARCQQPAQREQSISSQLLQDYNRLQRPAAHNVLFSKALKAFTATAVLAYECGCSEEQLREEISGSDSIRVEAAAIVEQDDIEDCIISLALVWITLSMLPSLASKRWATGMAVSETTQERWSGFVRMIVKGYFEKRWAAYPLDRLAAEVSISTGRTERPSTVSEWSRLVYATLENVAPQWPSE